MVESARRVGPPVKAYVRLADLIKASPLQADVQRLCEAQKRLLRFDTVSGASRGAPVMAGYVLPALGVGGQNGTTISAQAAQKRRTDERARLVRNSENNLLAFQNEARQNTGRRAAQKQSERIAEEEITGAESLRLARQRGERETRNKVALLTDPLTVGRGKNALLTGQLQTTPNGQDVLLPPVLDEAAFEKEIAALKADPKTPGISERARLELRRRTNQARIDALEKEIRQIVAQGTANVRADIARLRAERLAKIKQEIAQLKQDDSLKLVQAEQIALSQTLAAESLTANRAQIIVDAQGKRAGSSEFMAGTVVLADLKSGQRGSSDDVVGARLSALRLQKQRQILQALIVTDARESVRDNAQSHNVDVVIVEPGGANGVPVSSGRRDMTADFKRWFLSIGAGSENSTPNSGTRSRETAGKGRA